MGSAVAYSTGMCPTSQHPQQVSGHGLGVALNSWGKPMSELVSGSPDRVSGVPTNQRAIWPTAVIVFGLGLTVAWVVLIIFALVRLTELATRIASYSQPSRRLARPSKPR